MNKNTSTPRNQFLASNPKAKQLQDATIEEFRKRFSELLDGLQPMLRLFVNKSEQAREIGIVLCELADSLPGKKLTRDFYEQMKSEFVDSGGKQISFELLEWFMRVARQNPSEPIDNMRSAMKCLQPMLIASGEPEFQLVSDTSTKQRIQPKDEWNKLLDWLDVPDLIENWNMLKKNDSYFPGGHLREDLKSVFAVELKPKIAVIDELKRELGI